MRFLTAIAFIALVAPLGRAEPAGEKPAASPEPPRIMVSVADQKLALVVNGQPVKTYSISTSRFGLGDGWGTYRTPLGRLKVETKLGAGLPPGAVFRHRRPTGEVLPPNAPGRDPIVSRILWLNGQEPGNQNAYGRCVYIHGTPDEKRLGRPVSYGCIRMRSVDVIELFDAAPVGTEVSIVRERLPFGTAGFLDQLVASVIGRHPVSAAKL